MAATISVLPNNECVRRLTKINRCKIFNHYQNMKINSCKIMQVYSKMVSIFRLAKKSQIKKELKYSDLRVPSPSSLPITYIYIGFFAYFQEFISAVKEEPLARSLLHLAVCITNSVLEESAMELLAPGDKQEPTEQQGNKETKPPPRKGQIHVQGNQPLRMFSDGP